jgi:non-ribosomal peptide synthetase component F
MDSDEQTDRDGFASQIQGDNGKFISDPFRNDGGRLYKTGDLARYRTGGNIEFPGALMTCWKIGEAMS